MRGVTKLIGLTGLMAVALLTGCASKKPQHAENYEARGINVLGIVKTEPHSYAPTPSHSITLSSREVVATNSYSGDRVTFLWGLVTLKDY